MPRVSEQYIQRRRRKILDAAWCCFARNGFHATTMDDVIAAADASPGVVYRWFRGKDELVRAVVTEALQGVLEVMDELCRAEPPPALADAVEQIITSVLAQTTRGNEDLAAMPVQAWTEALRNPDIHALVTGPYRKLRDGFAELVRRHQAAGTLPPDIDPDAVARPLLSLLPGYILQHVLLGPDDPKTYAKAAHAILRA